MVRPRTAIGIFGARVRAGERDLANAQKRTRAALTEACQPDRSRHEKFVTLLPALMNLEEKAAVLECRRRALQIAKQHEPEWRV